jgi:hypothetical protein
MTARRQCNARAEVLLVEKPICKPEVIEALSSRMRRPLMDLLMPPRSRLANENVFADCKADEKADP